VHVSFASWVRIAAVIVLPFWVLYTTWRKWRDEDQTK